MEEYKIVSFLRRHGTKCFLVLLSIALLGVWGERRFRSSKAHSNQDFILLSRISEQFEEGEPLANESIESVENILKRHPELKPQVNKMLGMTYLAARNTAKGIPYLESSLKQAGPFYQKYGKTSLLIAGGEYDQAYQEARSLYTELQTDKEKHTTLYALNLLRLVCLEKEIGSLSTQEPSQSPEVRFSPRMCESGLTAWEELKAHPGYATIKPFFQEGNVSLEVLIN